MQPRILSPTTASRVIICGPLKELCALGSAMFLFQFGRDLRLYETCTMTHRVLRRMRRLMGCSSSSRTHTDRKDLSARKGAVVGRVSSKWYPHVTICKKGASRRTSDHLLGKCFKAAFLRRPTRLDRKNKVTLTARPPRSQLHPSSFIQLRKSQRPARSPTVRFFAQSTKRSITTMSVLHHIQILQSNKIFIGILHIRTNETAHAISTNERVRLKIFLQARCESMTTTC